MAVRVCVNGFGPIGATGSCGRATKQGRKDIEVSWPSKIWVRSMPNAQHAGL